MYYGYIKLTIIGLLSGGLGVAKDVFVGSNISMIQADGQINCTELITTSDQMFKKDIEVIDNPIDKIQQLRGCTYNWRQEEFPERHFGNDLQIGFMAQEVEAVLPQVVKTKADGYKGIAYDKLTALLVEGMKEQQNIIECLKEEIDGLKNNSEGISFSDGSSSYETPSSNISDTKIDELELDNECLKNEISDLREQMELIMSKINS